ncbi:MAG: protein kinase, partial [Sandaracinaceae bacterium]|nr:protein kinase [Sandaracinaceae bacterium]
DGHIVRYLAEHVTIRRPVELHTVCEGEPNDGDAAARLLREARVLGGATHRNLQGVVDSGLEASGRPYVVYESLRGKSLAEIVKPGGMPPERAARIVTQILEALRVLHDAGVVLRTLRPQDIMIEPMSAGEELVKIRGVHSAALLIEGGAEPVRTTGYSPYLAPELRRDEPGLDPRVDFFSVGVMLRELLTGTTRPGGELSDTARRAIARACADDPDERFANTDGFLQAVALLLPAVDRLVREQMPMPRDPLQADLQYLQLRRTTRHGPRDEVFGETRLHLLPVLLAIEAVYKRYGEDVWGKLAALVPLAEGLLPGAGNTTFNLEKGVPVVLFSQLMREIDRVARQGDLGLVPEIGEAAAQRGLRRLLRELPPDAGPEAIVDGFSHLWSRICRTGRARTHRLGERSARLWIEEQETPSLELAGFVAGLVRGAMKELGAPKVEVMIISAQALGDARDIFGVEW